MNTSAEKLRKGLKFVFGAIPLFILAPVLANIGFSALRKDNNYWFLITASVLGIAGIACLFIGIRTVLNSFFSKK